MVGPSESTGTYDQDPAEYNRFREERILKADKDRRIATLESELATLRVERDRAEADAAVLKIEHDGANERTKMVFDAMNHWRDRATAAEATVASFQTALEEIARIDVIGNARDPERSKRTTRAALENHRSAK